MSTGKVLAIAGALQWFCRSALLAQLTLSCQTPATCQIEPAPGTRVEFLIRASDAAGPVVNLPIRFFLARPGVALEDGIIDTVWTSASGSATFTWQSAGPPGSVNVIARAVRGAEMATLELRVRDPNIRSSWPLAVVSGRDQSWRPSLMLLKPVVVQVPLATTSDLCAGTRVAFRSQSGGSTVPDTAIGEWKQGRCRASARWQLGTHVGWHQMKVQVVGSTHVETVRAVARRAPQISIGIGFVAQTRSFRRLVAPADTVQVKRTTVVDGVTHEVTKDSVVSGSGTVKDVDAQTLVPDALLGIDFPLPPHWLRAFVGLSLENPTKVAHGGIHLGQLLFPGTEASGFGIYLGVRAIRREVGRTTGCDDGAEVCDRTELHWELPVLIVTADGSGLLSALLKSLGI